MVSSLRSCTAGCKSLCNFLLQQARGRAPLEGYFLWLPACTHSFACLLFCLLVPLYVCLFVCLLAGFVCLFVCLLVCLFVCLFVCLVGWLVGCCCCCFFACVRACVRACVHVGVRVTVCVGIRIGWGKVAGHAEMVVNTNRGPTLVSKIHRIVGPTSRGRINQCNLPLRAAPLGPQRAPWGRFDP